MNADAVGALCWKFIECTKSEVDSGHEFVCTSYQLLQFLLLLWCDSLTEAFGKRTSEIPTAEPKGERSYSVIIERAPSLCAEA